MFKIDNLSRKPIYEQLIEQLERLLLTGLLNEGDQLPSVRSLSLQLSVNPNTIQKAYSELDSRGLTCSVPGKGIFVAAGARSLLADKERTRTLAELDRILSELSVAGIERETVERHVSAFFEMKTSKSDTTKEQKNDSGT